LKLFISDKVKAPAACGGETVAKNE